MSFHYCGNAYDTLQDAARAYALTALPDADLCGIESDAAKERRGEVPLGCEAEDVPCWSKDARGVALDLHAFLWDTDPARKEERRIPTKDGRAAVDEPTWRELRIDAVTARITKARKEGLPS